MFKRDQFNVMIFVTNKTSIQKENILSGGKQDLMFLV